MRNESPEKQLSFKYLTSNSLVDARKRLLVAVSREVTLRKARKLKLFEMARSFTKVLHYFLHHGACLAAKPLSLGRLDTFRHMKDDITEASKGTECGISLESFGDLKKDDVIQVYSDIELPKVL